MITCAQCPCQNRTAAKYCKNCGVEVITAASEGDSFSGLIGFDEIRVFLANLKKDLDGRKRSGRSPNSPLVISIIGDAGTGKSLLGPQIAQELFYLKRCKRALPVILNALIQDDLDSKNISSAFGKAQDGVLFVDNAQQLISEKGEPLAAFIQIMQMLEAATPDTVVIFAGLPHRFRLFSQHKDWEILINRFTHKFIMDDYPSEQLTRITEKVLLAHGFTLSDAFREHLGMRMRWLFRASKEGLKDGEEEILKRNGHLSLAEADRIESQYYQRGGNDNILSLGDIKGSTDKPKTIEEIMAEVDSLIGMDSIKREMRSLHKEVQLSRRRAELGLAESNQSASGFHFTLTGNPGTGKTTVARMLGGVLEALGVLTSGHVVEVDRSRLVGQFQGDTPAKVVAACKNAEGGVLFIDEAYALYQGDNDSFGKEAIDTLLKRMEDDKGKYVVIAAGYQQEIEKWLSTNPGLPSRFPKKFLLDDYNAQELTQIFTSIAKGPTKNFELAPGVEDRVNAYFTERLARKNAKEFGNGREARNLVDAAIRAASERLAASQTELDVLALSTILPDDIPRLTNSSEADLTNVMADLDALTGLQGVKDDIKRLRSTLLRQRALGDMRPLSRHFVFTGNPGTGKTTVAKLMAKIFHRLGLLPTDKLVEAKRAELVSGYVGQTAKDTAKKIDSAMGGVLFIDEAYDLVRPNSTADFGIDAINTLLTRMDEDRGKFVVIVAGYKDKMNEFMQANDGLRGRFTNFIHFEDYQAEDMSLIFESMCQDKECTREAGFDHRLFEYFTDRYANRTSDFDNARGVRNLFDNVVEANGARVEKLSLAPDQIKLAYQQFVVDDLEKAIQQMNKSKME